jgi:uncharacterized repeat protein (TIGR01451 family)
MDCYSNNKPFDVFFVMDRSYSMVLGSKLNIMKTSFNSIIDALPAWSRASLITFNHAATLRNTLTTNLSTVRSWNPVDQFSPDHPEENSLTNYVDAFAKLRQEVNTHKSSFSWRNQLVYFFSDGEPTIGWPFVTQWPTQNWGNCTFWVINWQIVRTCSTWCEIPNDACQYESATAAADSFHAAFSWLQTIAIGLDISQQHHYILANHVATPWLFSPITSSVGISQVPKTPCYPSMQWYPNCTKPWPWTTQAFCASIDEPINPLNKFVDQFCEMTCEPALCRVYTGNFAQQPAYDNPTWCIWWTYSDLPDAPNQWNWQCTWTDWSSHTCAVWQEPTWPMCNELTVVNLTGSTYEFTCNGIWSNYSIAITDQQWQPITTLQWPTATYTFQTWWTFTATCFVDGITWLICPSNSYNPWTPSHDSNSSNNHSQTIVWNTQLYKSLITNGSATHVDALMQWWTVHQPIANKSAYDTALLQKSMYQILSAANTTQITEVKTNSIIVFAPPPPIISTAVPCYNPCEKTITIVMPQPEIFDLALRKTVADSVAWHAPWWFVTFDIEVINQWNVPAEGIIISDYVPVWLTLQDPSWSYDANTRRAKKSYDSILKPWETALLTITFKIDANASWKLINRTEITEDNWDDIDSTPDSDQPNDCFGGDNIVTWDGSGTPNTPKCTPETDEDDHDPAEIQIQAPTNPVYDLRIRKDVGAWPYKIGQTIQYTITVYNTWNITASWVVTDILPEGLNYTGWSTYTYSSSSPWWVTVSPITWWQRQVSNIAPGQYVTIQYFVIIWPNATVTLKNNVKIIPDPWLPPELVPDIDWPCIDDSIDDKNPLVSDSVNNINNAVSGTNNRDCEEIKVTSLEYDLRIKKDVSAWPYSSWQTITYTVTVLNTGTAIASWKVIDLLPSWLTYTWSEIFSSTKISKIATGSWMVVNLLPNEQVTITYKVLIWPISWPKKNIVSVFPEWNPTPETIPYLTWSCDSEIDRDPLKSDSTNNINNAVPGTNNTDCEEIVINESMSCIASVQPNVTTVKGSNHTMTVQCNVNNMTWTISVDCGNGTTGNMLTNNSAECKYTTYGSYVATCMINEKKITGCNKPITLESWGWGWTPSSICLSISPAKSTIYARKHDTNVTCNVKNYSTSDISVDCGNGTKKPWTNVTCEYRDYGSYTIQCLAKWKPADNCATTITLEWNTWWWWPNCGDGKKDKWEECDDWSKNWTSLSLCSKICDLKVINPTPNPSNETPLCAFVDPPSIQMGEYVPFWWDLEDDVDTVQGNNCTEKTAWKVRFDTMQCEFHVQAPWGKIYSYTRKCNEDNLKSVKWYDDLQKDLQTKIMPWWWQSVLNSSEWKESWYGEYAISLENIVYESCTETIKSDSSGKEVKSYAFVKQEHNGRVCQFNFAITAPYMMQKWSVLSSLEDDRDVLQSFHLLDWKSILDRRWEKINFLKKTANANTFEQVKKFAYDALDQVVSKIDATHPLALIAPVVKKSPREEIYLVESNVNFTHTSSIWLNRWKATTVIVKWPYTVTINWWLPANLLLIVPEGKVVFNNLDCDSNDSVEWILLAKDFETTSTRKILTNTDLRADERCQWWQLIVKWLIISDNANAFATLRSQRRSTLARWFDGTKTKEDHIYWWASLRIDANAHQWDKLPPLAKQTSMVFKLQGTEFGLSMPVYFDGSLLPFYIQMMIAAGEVSELK